MSERILVIDDEPAIRDFLKLLLDAAGYRVLLAADGATGLLLLEKERGAVNAVITDLMLPGMQGEEIIRELLSRQPGLGLVVMSGMTEDFPVLAKKYPHCVLLAKPMTADALLRSVQSALAQAPA